MFFLIFRRAKHGLLGLLTLILLSAPGAAEPGHRVLFISSYHPAFPSFDQQVAGLREGLAQAGFDKDSVIVDIEFMDTKRFPRDVQTPRFRTALAAKLPLLPTYDVIVVGDDNALAFALAEQDGLFAGQPIVFLGVNNIPRALAQNGNPRVTGVVERGGAADTLRLMAALYPDADQMYVIIDGTPSGRANRSITAQATLDAQLAVPLQFLSLEEYSYDQLFAVLKTVPTDTPVLLRNAYVDRNGDRLDYAQFMTRLRAVFDGPVFSLQQHGLGLGVLGGHMVSQQDQGRVAGEISARILRGTAAHTIPVTAESPNRYFFDWREVERLGLLPAALPDGAIYHNRTAGIFETHPQWVLAGIVLAVLQSAIIGWLIHAVIARRRAIEMQEAAAEEAALANRAKTEFLASMSHELRTPLNAIIGFSEFMSLVPSTNMNAERRQEYLRDIHTAGRHLLNMINDILDISRIEMGRSSFDEEWVDTHTILESCAELMSVRASETDVSLSYVPLLDPPMLHADETKLRQMVINLLSNAVKFSPAGTVTLASRIDKTGEFVICVQDTGIGIAERDLGRIIRPFDRGTSPQALLQEGVGLGLSIVARFAEMHGATVDIESRVGIGTTIEVRLPTNRVKSRAATSQKAVA